MSPVEAVEPENLDRLPQILLPGATRTEVKAFAMGAARSKGWMMVQSTDDRLVVQRPLDANSLTGVPPVRPGSSLGPGSLLEVTSYFIEQSGGVKIATKAELVTPIPGQTDPTRTDYTENYRDSLTQSLTSLSNVWSTNRGRIARATPPAEGWKDAWGNAPAKTATATDDIASVATGQTAPATNLTQTSTASTPRPRSAPAPVPPVSTEQPFRSLSRKSDVQSVPRTATSSTLRPAPEPRGIASRGAPVVDGRANASGTSLSSPAPVANAPLQSLDANPRQANMMALPATRSPVAASVSWAANAENYARERGCQVKGLGTELIEARADGEIHKVPCVGSDSFLVKCSNGICQGLL
jgi:hypothetical protein